MSDIEIPAKTRAYIQTCCTYDIPIDRARICSETGISCEYALYLICRVVSERYGIPCGLPWKEPTQGRPAAQRKQPKQRTNLKPCTCEHDPHLPRCPVYKRDLHRVRRSSR